jgi:hypothetical protein
MIIQMSLAICEPEAATHNDTNQYISCAIDTRSDPSIGGCRTRAWPKLVISKRGIGDSDECVHELFNVTIIC